MPVAKFPVLCNHNLLVGCNRHREQIIYRQKQWKAGGLFVDIKLQGLMGVLVCRGRLIGPQTPQASSWQY